MIIIAGQLVSKFYLHLNLYVCIKHFLLCVIHVVEVSIPIFLHFLRKDIHGKCYPPVHPECTPPV